VHTLPAVTEAARALPNLRFDWVAEEAFAEIPSWHPAVERVIPVALRRWRKHPLDARRSGEWQQFREQLAAQKYDLVIDGQGLLKSAFIARKVPAPKAGYDWASAREPLVSFFYQHKLSVAKDQHAVTRLRQLFAGALGYSVSGEAIDCGLERSRFAQPAAVGASPYLMFLHGTTRPDKHYPESYWRQLLELAAADYRILLPWGNDAERARAERLVAGIDAASVLPRMNLSEIARTLASAAGVVAVDTGLGHLSAALGVPAVSLYGPTSPDLVGAYGANQRYLCAKDFIAKKGRGVTPEVFYGLLPEVVLAELKRAIGG
jgi:heptosyltransferase-1